MENSIEEDIKNIEEIIELSKEEIAAKNENITAILDITDLISLKHILSDYKRVLKENEELKLKERRRIIGKYGELEIHDVINRTLSNDYIPVQKVKDKIEELQQKENIIHEVNFKTFYRITDLKDVEIKVLQELLESVNK